MSEYKTVIAEIVNEFKTENKQITSMKIKSELKKRHDINISNTEIKNVLDELESENDSEEESGL